MEFGLLSNLTTHESHGWPHGRYTCGLLSTLVLGIRIGNLGGNALKHMETYWELARENTLEHHNSKKLLKLPEKWVCAWHEDFSPSHALLANSQHYWNQQNHILFDKKIIFLKKLKSSKITFFWWFFLFWRNIKNLR